MVKRRLATDTVISPRARVGLPRGFVGLIVAVVLLLAATGGLALSLVLNLRSNDQDRIVLQGTGLSRTLADAAQRQFDVADLLLQFAAAEASDRISRGLTPSDAIVSLLTDRIAIMPQVDAVHVYDGRGRFWFAVGEAPMPLDISWHPGFIKHRDGLVQQIDAARSGGEPRVWLTRRINGADNSFAGVLIATLKIDLRALLDPAYYPLPVSVLALVHDEGRMVTGWPQPQATELAGLTRFVAGTQGYSVTGEDPLYWSRLNDLPMTLLMQLEQQKVDRGWLRAAIGFGMLFGIVTLGAIAAVWGAWRQLERRAATESLLRGMMDNPPLVMTLQDPHGRYLMINQFFARQFNRDPEDLVGRTAKEVFPPELAARLTEQVEETVKAGKPLTFDMRVPTLNGKMHDYMLVRFPIFDRSGILLAVGSIATDITERKALEAALREQAAVREKLAENYARQREVAETANRAKSEFLAHMSHELRTPLNAIIGFSDMIAGRLLGPQSAKYFEYAEDISSSAKHLLGVINDILDVSKIESGRFDLELGTHEPQDLVDDSLRLVRGRAREAGVQLVSRLPDALPSLLVDARAVKQILINLLSNAVKFTPTGGVVSVEAAHLPDGGLTLTVCDTGIGIAEDNLERVFEPFWQADAGIRRSEGSGLGLNICRKLIALHGGSISVASVPQQGTRVTVTFPAACVAPAAA
ncbi:ATP-binding protein [Ferrovibrio terrae]|uniref:ATP-binding protein n=1 Tax=Ferrovibrio terrae TaxID=2594003 RepID=UPI003137A248